MNQGTIPTILHTVHSLRASAGGPSRTVPSLCRAVAMTGRYRVVLLTTVQQNEPTASVDDQWVTLKEIPWAGRAWTPQLKRRFEQEILRLHKQEEISLIHDHGQWLSCNRAAVSAAKRLEIPRFVAPRGMLSPWALSYHGSRKKLLWLAHGRRDMQSASRIHATSELERDELLALGLTAKIDVVPNGIDLPSLSTEQTKPTTPRIALFLSRIHPKKGLPDLVTAWAKLRPKDWKVVIAGADEGGHLEELRRQIHEARLEDVFDFVGSVDGPQKWDLYQAASLFVLPSYSENFGVVIGEALACETPVITTRATPWEVLETNRCGWWVETGVDALTIALKNAFAQESELLEMGQRGRQFVQEHLDWKAIGRRMADCYDASLTSTASATN